MMQARVITDRAELVALEPAWQQLWAQQPRAEVFTHHAWARLFMEVYGADHGLHCVVVQEGDDVRGLLPLMQDAKGKLRFIGDPRSDYSDVLCAPTDAEAVVRCALASVKDRHALKLHAVPEHALLLQALNAMRGHKLTVVVEEPCPAMVFDAEGRVVREAVKKESLRRHEKKIAKLGPIRLQRLATQAEALAALPVLFDQHIARWKPTQWPSMFEKAEHRRFYERLVEDAVFWPMVDFRLLYAGDRVVATHFGFLHDRRFLWYKPSFDAELSAMGPGEVLLKNLIAATAAEGAREFDFTRGNEGFKQRFATVTRQNYLIHCPTAWQRLRSAAGRVRNALRKR